MANTLKNIVQLPLILWKITSSLSFQKKYLHNNIDCIINKAFAENDGTIKTKDSTKIYQYYGLAVPAILGEAFCELRGVKLTDDERWVLTCLGAITGLFDDFIDEMKMSEEQIEKLVLYPEKVVPDNSSEKLFLKFYTSALKTSNKPQNIKSQLIEVHHAQLASTEQENPDTSYNRILEITQQKGGESVVFYRTALNNIPDNSETKALFQLGATMQLENDIFDIYKDHQARINTIPARTKDIKHLKELYESEITKFKDLTFAIKTPDKNIKKFLNMVMPVLNRGFVCLKNLQKLQTIHQVFNIQNFTRKQLICDMENPINFLLTAYYQVKQDYKTENNK